MEYRQFYSDLKEEFDSSNKFLLPLIKLAKYYNKFDDFRHDYMLYNFHGIYWHLTHTLNFKINPTQSPTDLSSLSFTASTEPGLMVTTDIKNWKDTFENSRPYAALIDLSDLKPNVDYRNVKRGFGHEIYVFKPEKAKVIKTMTINKAISISENLYKNILPESSQELEVLYNIAHNNIQ